MQIGFDSNNNKIKPFKKGKATCRCCGGQLIAKCGDVNIWHWSHKNKNECEFEPMTQWHIDWQNLFDEQYREADATQSTDHNLHRIL